MNRNKKISKKEISDKAIKKKINWKIKEKILNMKKIKMEKILKNK